jgi:serine/threonine protein kinase
MDDEDHSANRVGQVLGAYRIERSIAVGTTASVWAARHVARDFEVVAKVHEADLADARDPASRERFLREATALAQVRHRNVVELFEVGETEHGEPYLIVEKLEGEALDERLLRGKPTLAEVLEVATGLLAGLSAVHAAGVIHRDIKPENVFLARRRGDSIVKLLDFGLARGLEPRGKKITRQGSAVGTPGYMSPEQARGWSDLDVRADLYSVGTVLYEMISGRVPFEGQTAADVMVRVCTEDPVPLLRHRPEIDPRIASIIMRALARDRDARYASAGAMSEALAPIVADSAARDLTATKVDLTVVEARERVPTPNPD